MAKLNARQNEEARKLSHLLTLEQTKCTKLTQTNNALNADLTFYKEKCSKIQAALDKSAANEILYIKEIQTMKGRGLYARIFRKGE